MRVSLKWSGRFLALAAAMAGGIFSIIASGGGGPVTPAQTRIAMVLKRPTDTQNQLCPRTDLDWKIEPVALTGNVGTTAPLGRSATFGGGNPVGKECTFSDEQRGLSPGKWRITATTGTGATAAVQMCEYTISEGPDTLTFWTLDIAGKVIACQ